ncbi:MAG: glutathione S-transferase [Rhodospirillales bacterium]
MLKLWGRVSSSNVQAVRWCLEELGLAYQRIDAGLTYGVVDSPGYRAMNPNGTVPTLQDADNPPLWESGAILRYLASRYGPESFWPADPVARAEVDKWAEWSKLNMAVAFTAPVFWRVVRTAPSKRNPQAIAAGLKGLGRALDIAEARLRQSPFLAGEAFTLADIQFGHCLYRYFDIEIERRERPALRRYYDALTARQPYRDCVMVSYEELRVSD